MVPGKYFIIFYDHVLLNMQFYESNIKMSFTFVPII